MTQATGKSMRSDWRAAWGAVRERLRRELGDPVFEAWIGPLSLESFEQDELKIGAVKPFVRNWVANHYVPRIERAFRAEGFTRHRDGLAAEQYRHWRRDCA
jgi:chromosomal replication initiator protein